MIGLPHKPTPCVAYLLECADGSLYAGATSDVERRLRQHNAGTASRYTRARLPARLVLTRAFPSRRLALAEERRVKRLTRVEKVAMIEVDGCAQLTV